MSVRGSAQVAAVLLAAFGLTGCGETRQQVIDRYRPSMDVMRAKLRGLHAKLPEEASPLSRDLDPRPEYDEEARVGNTDILAEEQLLDVDAEPPFDLILSSRLRSCLAWTGPTNPMAASALAARDGDFASEFDRALATRYLVVLRARAERVLVEGDRFRGGKAELDAFVVDLETEDVVAVARVEAAPERMLSYSYRSNENTLERATAAVHSSTHSNLRDELRDALAEATGGSFRFH